MEGRVSDRLDRFYADVLDKHGIRVPTEEQRREVKAEAERRLREVEAAEARAAEGPRAPTLGRQRGLFGGGG